MYCAVAAYIHDEDAWSRLKEQSTSVVQVIIIKRSGHNSAGKPCQDPQLNMVEFCPSQMVKSNMLAPTEVTLSMYKLGAVI